MSHKKLLEVYYAYFHSIMNYGLTFWESLHRMQTFLREKRIYLELLQDVEVQTHAEIYL